MCANLPCEILGMCGYNTQGENFKSQNLCLCNQPNPHHLQAQIYTSFPNLYTVRFKLLGKIRTFCSITSTYLIRSFVTTSGHVSWIAANTLMLLKLILFSFDFDREFCFFLKSPFTYLNLTYYSQLRCTFSERPPWISPKRRFIAVL